MSRNFLEIVEPVDLSNLKEHLIQRVRDLRESRTTHLMSRALINSSIRVNIEIYETCFGRYPEPEEFQPQRTYIGEFHVN